MPCLRTGHDPLESFEPRIGTPDPTESLLSTLRKGFKEPQDVSKSLEEVMEAESLESSKTKSLSCVVCQPSPPCTGHDALESFEPSIGTSVPFEAEAVESELDAPE